MEMEGIVLKQPTGAVQQSNALAFLANLDFIKIRQKVDLAELFTPWEVKNRYEVCDRNDQVFMYVTEESDTCERLCFLPVQRGLVLHVTDVNGQEIAQIKKNFKCCAGGSCCASADCCAMEMWVDQPVGRTLAHVRQMVYCCSPKFHVFDGNGTQVFEVTGPCCICQGPGCYGDIEYPLTNPGGSDANARVTKIWDGAGRACCTHANTFGCHFPANMDVQQKLSVFGSTFVLDYLLYENNGDQ
ncbi:phospholipid scramblase 3-like [Mizuhopecten yessoensis]|uniref:Phospholipid scramblase n=1 Tax=Mizuhopecten yessoensis TaxID=6573 RepID=A0A210PMJ8_MIZYE|nr:phospholipid scramblase 3-like [Mizuhopecten yessoensis]XP_021379767.1 phospholipid scramblase 3-like [Mizuhopecten yessoensis]OWF37708.1 Phospholipid scramblase 3 [Mizuhopecten yessoensis]